MALLCTSTSTFTFLHSPLHPQTLTLTPSPSRLSFPSKPLSFPRPLLFLNPLSCLPPTVSDPDYSFLHPSPSDLPRVLASGDISRTDTVLVSFGDVAFVDRLVEAHPCEVVLVVHESLLELALIKEKYDEVRCWKGPVEAVPEKFLPLDVVFVCYFPGLGVSADELFAALAGRCSSGARVVISFSQGRKVIEEVHKQEYLDVVRSDLPDKASLEKAAANHSFNLVEFVDDSTFYHAVLKFCGSGA